MADLQHHYRDPLVLDITDQAIVADPVTPESEFFALEGPSPLPRVRRDRESLSQKTNDCLLGIAVEFCDLLFGGSGDLNRPSQDAAPTL